MVTEKRYQHILKLAQLKKEKSPKVELVCDNCKKSYEVPYHRRKLSKYCSRICQVTSPERKKLSQKVGISNKSKRLKEDNPNWKNGKSNLSNNLRTMMKMRLWTYDIFVRDKFTCQKCGDDKGGNLNAHHKKHLSKIIDEFKIQSVTDAHKCNELWDLNNGITLCIKCHRKEHQNYSNRDR